MIRFIFTAQTSQTDKMSSSFTPYYGNSKQHAFLLLFNPFSKVCSTVYVIYVVLNFFFYLPNGNQIEVVYQCSWWLVGSFHVMGMENSMLFFLPFTSSFKFTTQYAAYMQCLNFVKIFEMAFKVKVTGLFYSL
jgi:hypothetical protein